jgi:hypothetical protein
VPGQLVQAAVVNPTTIEVGYAVRARLAALQARLSAQRGGRAVSFGEVVEWLLDRACGESAVYDYVIQDVPDV